eukprot:172630-Amphidinium_carterae.1
MVIIATRNFELTGADQWSRDLLQQVVTGIYGTLGGTLPHTLRHNHQGPQPHLRMEDDIGQILQYVV